MRYLGKSSVSSFFRSAVNAAWYIMIGAMALMLLASLTLAFLPPRFMHDFATDAISLETNSITLDFARLSVKHPRAIALGFLGLAFVMTGFVAAVTAQLRKILDTLRAEAPFAPENARRIRTMGILIIAGTVVKSFLLSGVGFLIMQNVAIDGVHVGVRLGSPDLAGILTGFLVLILAEVFRYGAELQEDRNLTV